MDLRGRRSQWKWMRVKQKGTGGEMRVKENTDVRRRRLQSGRETPAQQTWRDKKRNSPRRNHGTKKKNNIKNVKKNERNKHRRRERKKVRERENPLKGEWERRKKWQAHKDAWNSLLQGPPSSLLPLCLPLASPHSHTLSHLAQAVLNLGTLALCQA